MSSEKCYNLITELCKSVDKTNFDLTNSMTNISMKYKFVCIKPDLSYNFFYMSLKKDWENLINDSKQCGSVTSDLMNLYKFVGKDVLEKGINSDKIIQDLTSLILNPELNSKFVLEKDFIATLYNFLRSLNYSCSCNSLDFLKMLITRYSDKLKDKFKTTDPKQITEFFKHHYNYYNALIERTTTIDMQNQRDNVVKQVSDNLTNVFKFSVESELNKLIPDELGSLKEYFVKVISTYYNKLHPIVWAQILKKLLEEVFVDLPFTTDQVFQFVSKHLLLNSGPFILKMLQTIRPILSKELAMKYNLTKLNYPKLTSDQIQMIFGKVVVEHEMINIMFNVSASVGHVCVVSHATSPNKPFVIKIIKPISIAQSCWEYETLHNIYPEGTCEQKFIKNTLLSSGLEMNVEHEIDNLKHGHEYYSESYDNAFSHNNGVSLTTIQSLPGKIKEGCWYALAMSFAEGVPLSELVESNKLSKDTKFRAVLHRGLDLLVYKFFLTIIQHGFYHGDLHAGNIFYSYKNKKLTLIDFGAVGYINIFEDDLDTQTLLKIVVMSIFYNFDEILDVMTDLMNSKCDSKSNIDKDKKEYKDFKNQLYKYKVQNIQNFAKEHAKYNQYNNDIFSEKRFRDENNMKENKEDPVINEDNIYSYLEIKPKEKEIIVENQNSLPVFTEVVGESESVTFAKVLELIIKFYASSGTNVAIKFNEFSAFQKAYTLLLGVLSQTGYNSYRMGMALNKAIINWSNLSSLKNIKTVTNIISVYWDESTKYKSLTKTLMPDYGVEDEKHAYFPSVTSCKCKGKGKEKEKEENELDVISIAFRDTDDIVPVVRKSRKKYILF